MTAIKEESQVARSMYNNKDFVYAYGWNRVMMKAIGGWPEDDDNFFMKNRVYLNAVLLALLIVLPQLASIQVFWGDLSAVIECISVNLAIDLSLLKLFWLGAQRSTIQHLLKMMADDWLLQTIGEEREEMMKMAEIIRSISSCSFYGTIGLFIAFVPSQTLLGLELKKDPTIDQRLTIGLLYPSVFPFNTSSISVFSSLWIGQFIMTYISMASYSSADSFFAMFVYHQCGQLKVLRRRLQRIVSDEIIGDRKKFWKKVGEIVERHEHLNKRTLEIEENFNKVFLVVVLITILTTCFQGFSTLTLLENTDEGFPVLQILAFIAVTTYDVGHFFVYCWAGDILMAESSDLGISFYNSEWYNLSSNEAKSLLIINNRCKRPQKITGGKFTIFTLPLFTAVVKTSASYLSVLLAMKV